MPSVAPRGERDLYCDGRGGYVGDPWWDTAKVTALGHHGHSRPGARRRLPDGGGNFDTAPSLAGDGLGPQTAIADIVSKAAFHYADGGAPRRNWPVRRRFRRLALTSIRGLRVREMAEVLQYGSGEVA